MKRYQLLLLVILVVSCGPSIKTERVSLQKSDEYSLRITDDWVATDTEIAIKDVLRQIDNHRGFQTYLAKLGRKPKLFIGEVQNKTSEASFFQRQRAYRLHHELLQGYFCQISGKG